MAEFIKPRPFAAGQDIKDRRKHFELIRSSLETERASFDSHWRELGDYVLPRRTRFWVTDRNRGDRRSKKIIDSTATFAARTLMSGMHAGLTSPARPWMRLTTPDPSLAEFGPVKNWLHTVTQRMLAVFSKSNLYNALPDVYRDLGVFATAAMSVLKDDEDLIRCFVYPIGSYAIAVNERGIVDTFVREFEMGTSQLVDKFGRNDPDDQSKIDWNVFTEPVKRNWELGNWAAPVNVVWVVMPNPDHRPGALAAKHKKFISVYYERGQNTDQLLRESGFDEFPILVPRWDVNSEDSYGTGSPGMDALSDIKQLQTQQRKKGQAIEKQINPPVQGPPSLRSQKTSLLPGHITYVNVREGQKGLSPVHEVRASVAEMVEDIRETQFRIRRAWYEDLFLMLASQRAGQPVTAREIDERHEEKLLALGPVLERTNDELLDPLVDRTFALMFRAGLIPPPPPELEGVDLKVEYVSLLAQAQKLVTIISIDRFVTSAASLTPIFPEARHKVNIPNIIDGYADAIGVDPSFVRPNDEAAELGRLEQEQIAEAARAQELKDAGAGVKSLADADTSQPSALDALTGGGSRG